MGIKTYVQFPENYDLEGFGYKLRSYTDTYLDGVFAGETRIFHVMPMLKIHLHGHFAGELEPNGDARYVYIFSIIAILILLIACCNYINLSTAQSSLRAAEVGLRKVIGAGRKSLLFQFLGESLALTVLATALAVGAALLLLPAMNALVGREMSFAIFKKSDYAFLLALPLFTAALAGGYPALYLSSLQPAKTLKNTLTFSGNERGGLRNTLVIVQFSIAIAMIVATLVIARQMHFIKNRDLGFAHTNVLMIPLPGDSDAHYAVYKRELLSHHLITAATIAHSPIHAPSFAVAGWEGKNSDELVKIYLGNVDYGYIDFYDLEIVQGRNFSRTMPTDSAAFILNEKAIETYGIENPIGKRFSAWSFEGPIIGIIKDYHFTSLQLPIAPLALSIAVNSAGILAIKATGDVKNLTEVIAYSETAFKKVFPGIPFEYTFLDEDIGAMYKAERKLGELFNIFTLFAIIISCLGLYGLVLFLARRKTKEIGIRKVLGASAAHISYLLTVELLKWIAVAAAIGAPFAWILMKGWLRNYAYKVPLSPDIFALAVGIALIIALLTVSYNAMRSALANPVDSLRNE